MSSAVERLEAWCREREKSSAALGLPRNPAVDAYRHLIARYQLKEHQADDSALHIRLQEQRAAEAQELEHVISVLEEAVNPEGTGRWPGEEPKR